MGRATPDPKFPDGVWDGTTKVTPSVNIEKTPDFFFGARYRSEIIALEQTLASFLGLLEKIKDYGVANSILGVKGDGTELEYKLLVEGSNISIVHGPGTITISSSGGSGTAPITAQVDADVIIGNPLYVKSNGHVEPAKADASGTTQVAGVAITTALTGNTCDYITEGQVTQANWTFIIGSTSLTPGATYYLSASTAGLLTTTAPTSTSEYVVRVGRAVSTTKLDVEIELPILL